MESWPMNRNSRSCSTSVEPAPNQCATSGAFNTSSPQQSLLSASDQLQSYINRFERSQGSTPAPTVYDSFTPHQQQSGAKSDDTGDAWDLLCGRGGGHVSVKTRCILRDVDRELGYTEPCYSAQEKLNLRSFWPSMHEHLERRWRQQLRKRYEVRQLAEAAASATEAEALSRAELYRYRRNSAAGKQRIHFQASLSTKSKETIPVPVRAFADGSDIEDDAAENSVSESGGSSVAVATAAAARSSEERLWGSDSGIGQSYNGAAAATATPARATAAALNVAADDNDDAANDDSREVSFEERMRSYRCVLEAHELSSRLRQHLEAACATVGSGGKRVLSVEDKGRIRERLARLQGPQRGGFVPPDDAEQQLDQQQEPEAERITTERLSRLMSSVRSLLSTRDDDGEEDRLWLERLSKQQEQQAQSEPQQVIGDAALEAGQEL